MVVVNKKTERKDEKWRINADPKAMAQSEKEKTDGGKDV